jgi:hypothetical protein
MTSLARVSERSCAIGRIRTVSERVRDVRPRSDDVIEVHTR